MDWTSSAWSPTGSDAPRGDVVDALCVSLAPGERVLAAIATTRFELPPFVGKIATVVLTTKSVIVAKEKIFGRPKPNLTLAVDKIQASGVGPLLGVGPTWEVNFRLDRGQSATIYFQSPPDAERFEQELKRAAGRAGAEANDPDLARLHLALEMSRDQPNGQEGKLMQPAQVSSEAQRLRERYRQGNYQFVWDRRVQLGYGVPEEGVASRDYFWLNAAPALAALKLGLKEHPMVSMCCGVAEQHADRSDPEQNAAVQDFNRLFFS